MTTTTSSLKFDPPVFLRIGLDGFLCQGREHATFSASLLTCSTVRKRFLKGILVCFSSDGHKARDGASCQSCPHLQDCLPRIRLRLRPLSDDLPHPIFLELSFSSAKNFLEYFTNIQSQGIDPYQVPLRLNVLNRGRWGEVLFSVDHP